MKSRLRVGKKSKDQSRVVNFSEAQPLLASWLNASAGCSLYRSEQQICEDPVFRLPGYRAAQLGLCADHSLIQNMPQQHKFVLSPHAGGDTRCVCDFQSLPFPSNTIDVVLLHHVLEFAANPHQLLAETARVVAEGGHIVIVVFNPFSVFGMSKWGMALFGRPGIWQHRSLRKARLIDWLQLIGFQIVAARLGKPANKIHMDIDSPKGLRLSLRRRFYGGSFYVLVARKNVVPVTPVRNLSWHPVAGRALNSLKTVNES